jgi:hypothetical protein
MAQWRNAVTIVVCLVSVVGLAGCGPEPVWSPSAPSPDPNTPSLPAAPVTPRAFQLATFTDSGFSTSDVLDVHGEVLQFNLGADELIWTANGARFSEFIVEGNHIGYHHKNDWIFQVRFGTRDGEWRAFITRPDSALHGAAPTILDLWVDERGDLKIVETGVAVAPG